MSLTTGRGPLSRDRAGYFNSPVPDDMVYVEPFPRRVRGLLAGRSVVDSEGAVLVHRPGRPPAYAFPLNDVHGIASEPEPDSPGFVRVPWEAVEAWYEEDEQMLGHPRNPYHRVDCIRTSRRLHVQIEGVDVVDTMETIGVYETALAPRLYVRPQQVRTDLLVRSSTTTFCPYKGMASYWSATIDGVVFDDVAWSYEDPFPECLPIAGCLSFYEDRAQVMADLPGVH